REQPARGPAKRGSTANASRHARPTLVATILVADPRRPRPFGANNWAALRREWRTFVFEPLYFQHACVRTARSTRRRDQLACAVRFRRRERCLRKRRRPR